MKPVQHEFALAVAALGLGGALGCAPESSNEPRLATEDGLVLLYDFDEGSGDVVRDRSGLEPALDLQIEDSGAVQWLQGRLQVVGGLEGLRTRTRTDRLVEVLQRSNAVTFELWIEDTQQGQAGALIKLSGEGAAADFIVSSLRHDHGTAAYHLRLRVDTVIGSTFSYDVDRLDARHIVFARDDRGIVTLYLDGVPTSTSELVGTFDTWSFMFEVVVGSEWTGVYDRIALYNRGLTAQEVADLFSGGP